MSGGKAGKAVLGLGADTPFHEAASLVIRRRLGSVADAVERLGRSRGSAEMQPDDIHQVRVSVRRASAALGVFVTCISSPRRLEKVRKRLRGLRRAIGTARACDVGLSILAHDRGVSGDAERVDLSLLEGVLVRRREKSMREVCRAIGRCAPDRLRRWGRRLAAGTVEVMEHASLEQGWSLEQAARVSLGELLADIRRCGRTDLQEADSLHELRLSAKRLRYATEVFGPCFQPERLDEAANLLVRVQDRLGAVNDLHEIVTLINERIAREQAGDAFATLLAEYSVRYEHARAEFVAWWRQSGDGHLAAAYRGLVDDWVAEEGAACRPAWSLPRIAPITPGVNRSEA